MVLSSRHDVGTISSMPTSSQKGSSVWKQTHEKYIYIKEFQVDDKGMQKTQYQIVALYVDDLIIAASTKNLLTALEGVFESRFKMKKLNQIKQILGMGVQHDKDRNIIYVTQQLSLIHI